MPDRRQFLQFLAASPFFAAAGLDLRRLGDLSSGSPRRAAQALSLTHQALQRPVAIGSAADALSVLDFEPAAKARIPVAHWAYLETGTDGDETIRANREGFARFALRARRMINVESVDAGVSLFSFRAAGPISRRSTRGSRSRRLG